MIYKKEANFPYPVLSKLTEDYKSNSSFELDVGVSDLDDSYGFNIEYTINSKFINELLEERKANLYLVVESKDEKFYLINGEKTIKIKKNRISLSKRTDIQLFIVASIRFNMKQNNELDEFYDDVKHRINLEKGNVIALSNVERFDGDLKKPYDLFEYGTDETIESDIKIQLQSETIKIIYKDKKFQYSDSYFHRYRNSLNYHYVYLGLQRALTKFVISEGDDGELDISNIEEEPTNKLYFKLYNLLKEKNVDTVNLENLDYVIAKTTDDIINKHYQAIRGLSINGA